MALTTDPPPHKLELPNRLPYFAFRPRKDIDRGMLSVYDATAITPAECLNLYNRRGDRQPATTVARITAGDCSVEFCWGEISSRLERFPILRKSYGGFAHFGKFSNLGKISPSKIQQNPGDFQRYGLEIRPDPGSHPAHCLVDFRDLTTLGKFPSWF